MMTGDALPERLRLPPRPKRKHAARAEPVADAPASTALPSFYKGRRGVRISAYLDGWRRRPSLA
jgi:hypothetical protein